MNKNELVKEVASKTGFQINQTDITINALFETISRALKKKENVRKYFINNWF